MGICSRLGHIGASILVVWLVVACDSGTPAATPTAPRPPTSGANSSGTPSRTYVVGMSQANKAEPWRTAMNSQIATAAQAYPELQVMFTDAAQDNAKQVSQVDAFIQQKVDLLIISPNEAAPLTAVVKKAYDAGIPVIVLDRAVLGDAYTMFIGADNVQIGQMAGQFVSDWCTLQKRNPCSVLELRGLSGSPPAADRASGFRTGIAHNPNVQIVADPAADWLREKAVPAAAAAFQTNDQIDVVYGHNDPMAEGAYTAAKTATRDTGKMLFVGIDALPTADGGIRSVLDGRMGATFVYPTGGSQAIDWAVKILEQGAKPPKKIVLETEQVDNKTAAIICQKYNCPNK